jgi:hypothetical protein
MQRYGEQWFVKVSIVLRSIHLGKTIPPHFPLPVLLLLLFPPKYVTVPSEFGIDDDPVAPSNRWMETSTHRFGSDGQLPLPPSYRKKAASNTHSLIGLSYLWFYDLFPFLLTPVATSGSSSDIHEDMVIDLVVSF